MVSDSLTRWGRAPRRDPPRPFSLSSLSGVSTPGKPGAGASVSAGGEHTLAGSGSPPAGRLFSPANTPSVALTARGGRTHREVCVEV
ncbi:hypothetical protein PBY51_016633 [Eleginops maclovinus]|uniref:Uncharacterized protein n=1 Tax=Eleginops maclovinus TaxID=56733 RepID=A0AAN7ZTS0_ELEMC|nr:hypothetical protein PBY51_016633 [Eleginops maclovinus]